MIGIYVSSHELYDPPSPQKYPPPNTFHFGFSFTLTVIKLVSVLKYVDNLKYSNTVTYPLIMLLI